MRFYADMIMYNMLAWCVKTFWVLGVKLSYKIQYLFFEISSYIDFSMNRLVLVCIAVFLDIFDIKWNYYEQARLFYYFLLPRGAYAGVQRVHLNETRIDRCLEARSHTD